MIGLTYYAYNCTEEVTPITDVLWPQNIHLIPETIHRLKFGRTYPPHKLVDTLELDKVREFVDNNPVKGKTGFILAAGSQNWAGINGKYDNNPDAELYYKCKVPFLTLTTIYAGKIASSLGAYDYVSTDATACASSLKVLMEVENLMNNFGFDRMIILSLEDAANNATLGFFGESKAALTLEDEETVKPSAFDDVNYGFNIGQGAVVAVFDKDPQNYKARLHGACTAGEQNDNPLGQRPDGAGYTNAIKGALQVAKLTPNDVNLVKTHGTGTQVNNVAEKSALLSTLYEFIATSYKPRIGHTVAASGLLETCLLLDDIKKGYVPAIANRTSEDDVFLSHNASVPDGAILSLAAGMGNAYSAAIFSVGE